MNQLIWSHGWGFDRTFFSSLCLALPEYEHFIIDWGYFNTPSLPQVDQERPLIGIGHSLGFAKLFNLPFSYKGVVSLGGFTRFCQIDRSKSGTPKRILERMLNQFQNHPHQVLQNFYRSCGLTPLFMKTVPLNTSLLFQDLNQLIGLNIDLPPVKCLALAARNDQISSLLHQQDLFPSLEIMEGEHNFPLQSCQETAFLIHQFLKNLSLPGDGFL